MASVVTAATLVTAGVETITDVVVSGPLTLAVMLAFAAGTVSFASPCCIPLVPGYLSYLAGLVGADTTRAAGEGELRVRRRAVGATLLFIAGFTAVFLAQTAAVLGVAHALLSDTELLMRVGGTVTIVMGLVMLGFIRPLQREFRIHARPTGPVAGALLLGGTFGLGWVVCIGPTLAGIIALATATDWGGSAWRGMLLVVFYCLGLGLPFLLLSIGLGWAATTVGFLRRQSRTLQVIGGLSMVILGVLMLTGLWGQFVAWLQVALSGSTRVWL